MAYESVNAQWPAGTRDGRDLKPTPQEAMAAAKRLYRFGMKKPFRGKVVLTSGKRHTWIRNHVLYVNPDEGWSGGGWHEIVHSMSHLCAQRLFPNADGHGHQHAFLEKEMIAHVVASGWLDGKLRRDPKPVPDKAAIKRERTAAAIRRWEAKQRRAANALKKLRRQAQRIGLENNLQ
jgi:hypothetical protein